MFILWSYVRNLARKKVDEFWYEHPNDFIIVKMWVIKKNLDFMLYYIKDAPLDLNFIEQRSYAIHIKNSKSMTI